MTFLNPAILFGLIAAGIPVMIHLLNLRRLKKIEFSTLAFLKEIQKSKIRRVKLKQWILLALRVLIIMLLVTAFARPALEGTVLGGAAPEAKSSIVIILDNSFSMSANTGKGTLLNQAKNMIQSIISESKEGDDYSLILTSAPDNNLMQDISNRNEFLKLVDAVEISQVSGTIESAVFQANKILMSTQKLNKFIYMLTDFQQSMIQEKHTGADRENLSNSGDINLFLLDYSEQDPVNLSVIDFESDNQVFEVNKQIGFTAEVKNFSKLPIDNSIASLFINGKREAQHSISLEPGAAAQVSFETTLKTAGLINAECVLEDDEILNDNTRHVSFLVPEDISVLIIADYFADSKYLQLALSGINNDNFIISKRITSQSGSINFGNYDVIFVIGTERINNFSSMLRHIEAGGSIVLMPGAKSSLAKFQSALRTLSLPVTTGIIGDRNLNQSSASFDEIDLTHPLFSNMFDEADDIEIDPAAVYKYFNVKTGGLGQNIITLNTGYSFMSEYQNNSGKIILFNCAPVLSSSNFPLKGIFAPLITKLVYYISSNASSQSPYFAGDKIEVNISGRAVPQLKIIRPDGSEEYVNVNSSSTNNYFRYENSELTGTYQFLTDDKLFNYAVVNTNPLESDTRYLPEDDFATFLDRINFEGTLNFIPIDSDIDTLVKQHMYGTELWKPLLIFALLIAILEMIISKSSKKDMAGIPNST